MLNSYVCTFLLLCMQIQNPIFSLLHSILQGGQFSCVDHQSISVSLSLVSNLQEFMPVQIESYAGMGTCGTGGGDDLVKIKYCQPSYAKEDRLPRRWCELSNPGPTVLMAAGRWAAGASWGARLQRLCLETNRLKEYSCVSSLNSRWLSLFQYLQNPSRDPQVLWWLLPLLLSQVCVHAPDMGILKAVSTAMSQACWNV